MQFLKIFKKRSLWVMLTAYLSLWLAVAIVTGVVMDSYKKSINSGLGLTGTRTETIQDGEQDAEHYKSKYVQKDENGNVKTVTDSNGYTHQLYDDKALWDEDVKKADQVQREGTTILWNSEANGLPLSAGNKVSVFSHSSVDYVYSGTGAGESYTTGAPTVKSALTNAGLSVNNTLWNFYSSGAGKSYTRTNKEKINEVPWSKYTDEVKNSFSTYGDAAIFVLSRKMGEGAVAAGGGKDATDVIADTPSGDYFDISAQESKTIQEIISLKNSGTFKKFIILLNTPTDMWFSRLFEYKNDIDSCVWVGQSGYEGLNEVGRILTGESIPSGHLVDTFVQNTRSAPAYINSKYTSYGNSAWGWADIGYYNTYMIYAENIYVGYKYYETRYEDAVLGRGNATSTAGAVNSNGNWTYSEEVAFPFGYGGSYTTFEYSDYNVVQNKDGDYEVTVTVKNTGSKTGADAVQVYVQKPYTDYDKQYGLEQSAVNLAGYAKTAYLEPNQTETVKITVDQESFKTYDDENKNTYIREKGTYYITVAEDAHAAVNNILAKKGKTPANTGGVMDAEGKTNLVASFDFASDDFHTYSVSSTKYTITNQFEDTDYNKYEDGDGQKVTYLSRNDWQATYPTSVLQITATEALKEDIKINNDAEENPDDQMPLYEQPHQLNLIDLKGKDFNDVAWDILLDQLSLDEQIQYLGKALFGTPAILSINAPATQAKDGPSGVGYSRTYKTNLNTHVMCFPSAVLMAATYNDKLIEEVGELIGEDCLHAGVTGLYGPGANIHRTTYGGRSFEYYSEDGFISGQMLKAQVKGIQSTGVYVNVKHFLLNDQESNRYGVAIWANEQSIREIYLEAFRPVVEEAGCTGLMSSFTRFGAKWSGAHKGLCTEVLRNEWGYKGFVISDCAWRVYMGALDGIMAGNDNFLSDYTIMTDCYKAEINATIAKAIRESTHRVLYVIANSAAMNGFSSNTRVYEVKEWWQVLVTNVQITIGVITGVLLVLTVLSFVFHDKIKQVCGDTEERAAELYAQEVMKSQEEKIAQKAEQNSSYNTSVGGGGNNGGGNGGKKFKWTLKQIVITSVCVVLVIAIVVTSIVLPQSCNSNPPDKDPDNGIIDDGGGADDGEGDNNEEDEGGVKDYRFEAEGGVLETTIAQAGIGIESGCKVAPSGGAYVFYLSGQGTATLTYEVYAESATEATLTMCMGLGWAKQLSNMFTLTINDSAVELPDITFPNASSDDVRFYDWTETEITTVNLSEGNNTIVFTKATTANASGLNFDYFELTTETKLKCACEVTNEHIFNEYEWVTEPTATTAGVMSGTCRACGEDKTVTIPALSESNGWIKQDSDDGSAATFGCSTWSYNYKGTTIELESLNDDYTAYKFEAERGTMGGRASATTESGSNNPSGGMFVGNMSKNESSITLEINSSKATKALFTICFGCRNDWDIQLSDGRTLTVNGTSVALPNVNLTKVSSSINYFNWKEFKIIVIDLVEGKNTITLSNQEGKIFSNVDYFKLTSDATLEWFFEE